MIAIVDYGMGNLGSIQNMLRKIGVESVITSDPKEILAADKLILPGVGAFDNGMKNITERKLLEPFNNKVLKEKTPVLGICLGMQLLTNGSEEGSLPGLGWIPARTIRFSNNNGIKVPHMGWNTVKTSNHSKLTENLLKDSRFYFVHSYYVKVENEENSILKTEYGLAFDSAIQKDNIFGVQFHPEKSHKFGMQLLRNYAAI